MKKSKKIILCSEIALISMASFGCVYGPPPDEDVFESSSDIVSVTENIDTEEETEQNTDVEE